ncbi:hypothetical protein BCR34DRAFT_582507 [Clohesyomyces aquaticus]|uniref:Uncharacterized protein n=1 Tax=Clohesyomyces aquaticus TaxID=1231657 RepID=A0A1Y2A8T6_9PLEO|nr:hypothetical protein BCR34DRAFT_582507 [Clohesyomyces aquaticus]
MDMDLTSVVIVTATEYFTVSPGAPVTAIPSNSPKTPAVFSPTPVVSSVLSSVTSHSITPLPSSFVHPTSSHASNATMGLANEKHVDNTIPIVALITICIVLLAYMVIFGLLIFGYTRGSCERCKRLEDKIKDMRGEKTKDITVEMVQARMSELEEARIAAGGMPGEEFRKRHSAHPDAYGPEQEPEVNGHKTLWPVIRATLFPWKSKETEGSSEKKELENYDGQQTTRNVSPLSVTPPRTIPSPHPSIPSALPHPPARAHHGDNNQPCRRHILSELWDTPQPPSPPPKPIPNHPADRPRRGYRDTNGQFHSFVEDYPGGFRWPHQRSSQTGATSRSPQTNISPVMGNVLFDDREAERYREANATASEGGPDAECHRAQAKIHYDRMLARRALDGSWTSDALDFETWLGEQAGAGQGPPHPDRFAQYDAEVATHKPKKPGLVDKAKAWWKGT